MKWTGGRVVERWGDGLVVFSCCGVMKELRLYGDRYDCWWCVRGVGELLLAKLRGLWGCGR